MQRLAYLALALTTAEALRVSAGAGDNKGKIKPFFGLDIDAAATFGDVCTNGDGQIDIGELEIWWADNGDEERCKKDLKRLIK